MKLFFENAKPCVDSTVYFMYQASEVSMSVHFSRENLSIFMRHMNYSAKLNNRADRWNLRSLVLSDALQSVILKP